MTLANSNTVTQHGNTQFYEALITATGNDTTANADSNVISNLDGSIKNIWAGVKATNQTGTSPTLQIVFRGSFDNSVYFDLPTQQDQDDTGTYGVADSSTLDINTASTTNVAAGISTGMFGLETLPPYIKVRITVGGSSTPGWTGVVSAAVQR